MFIKNYEVVPNIKTCKEVGKYIISRGVPLLSLDNDGSYIFANTEIVRNILNNLPISLKNNKR